MWGTPVSPGVGDNDINDLYVGRARYGSAHLGGDVADITGKRVVDYEVNLDTEAVVAGNLAHSLDTGARQENRNLPETPGVQVSDPRHRESRVARGLGALAVHRA